MMANLTSNQAKQLSENFRFMASAIQEFRRTNWDLLTPDERLKLKETRDELLSKCEDILASSTTLIMDEVSDSLGKIKEVTADIKGTISRLQNIQKGLNVAAALLALGIAITARDPQNISKSIKSVFETWTASAV